MARTRRRTLETLCLPAWCPYAYACPTQRGRERRVSTLECLRHRPEGERPEPALSAVALELLYRLRREGIR